MTTKAMTLENLLNNVPVKDVVPDVMVSHISLDSKDIKENGLFIALTGDQQDGRDFIAAAIDQGAVAVFYDNSDGKKMPDNKIPVLGIEDLRNHVGAIANNFYDKPSLKLTVIGITGTNGKTTCAHLLANILDKENERCAIIGTLGNGFPDALEPAINTTPDVISLHRQMADFFQMGARFVCMEVSSHALVQGRVNGVAFDIAMFTNLSHDHLDYHGNMDTYGDAKEKLFSISTIKHCIINCDDKFGKELINKLQTAQNNISIISYGIGNGMVSAQSITSNKNGIVFRAVTQDNEINISSQLFGQFNVYNLLAVLACLLEVGLSLKDSANLLGKVKPVAGRMEQFNGSNLQPLVIVDYAHTPDALEKALLAVRDHCRNMIWCVFGCGGDRDKKKRSVMGRIASQLADYVILTNDNPRTELPEKIIKDIEAGFSSKPKIIYEREDAIRYAITNAKSDDVVLVAGKGHETYQQIGDKKIDFSDRLIVREILRQAA